MQVLKHVQVPKLWEALGVLGKVMCGPPEKGTEDLPGATWVGT